MSLNTNVGKFMITCTTLLFLASPVFAATDTGGKGGDTGVSQDTSVGSLLLAGKGKGQGYGPGDGSGNGGSGPKDGSGNGPGDCTTTAVFPVDAARAVARGDNGNGGHGPGDGTGNGGNGPGDGTGNGPGTGTCTAAS
jgi:hypothetical protein